MQNNRSANTSYYTFPDGMRMVHRQTESSVTYVGIMVGAGTRHETEAESGLAHYIEHCVFKGTEKRTSKQIINHIESIGGEINAYTTKEETVYYAAVPSSYTARALDLLFDMVFHPKFPKQETDKEKQVIYDEIESYNDSPSELIYDDFEALVFAGSNLAGPILGQKKTIRRFTAETAHAFMQRTYQPQRMVVFAESNRPISFFVRQLSALENVRATFESASREKAATNAPVLTSDLPPLREQQLKKRTHQAHVMIGGRAFPLGHPDQLCAYLLNHIVGGGSMSSLLNMSLREQKGLVYQVDSIYTPLSDTGYWSIYFASEPENKEECLRLVRETLQHLAEKPLSEAAVRRAKKQLRGQLAIAAENRENAVLSMAKLVLYHGTAPTWQDTMACIDGFTAADLQRVAATLYAPDNMYCLQYI